MPGANAFDAAFANPAPESGLQVYAYGRTIRREAALVRAFPEGQMAKCHYCLPLGVTTVT